MTEANPPAQVTKLGSRILVSGDHHKQLKVLSQEMSAALATMTKSFERLQFPIIRMPPMPTLKILETLQANWFTGVFPPPSFIDNLQPTCSPATLEPSPQVEEFRHSPDYATVIWKGQPFYFNRHQAACVSLLHEGWMNGTEILGGHYLLSAIESASRMSDLFKHHPAWGSLIVLGERKATYRLNLSPKFPPNSP
ncbi:hypothetical protein M1O55_03595 [Dehalococcoidia bacterium]|nr:hypothetical protein [Dehalococcoidia bacterium]